MVTIKHLGDITKISGYSSPIVDCIIGGSPCQDLSVAGKRAGLDGERSGLFMEQVRIVKEMRKRDIQSGRSGVDVRPRYMVWENVPGAFSSNKGEDFRIVLEELAKVNDENAVIPRPEKWQTSGCIMADGWSIAWRVLDAQFWGVPQRRRRIALVADFGGHSAPEILFVRKSVSGHSESSKQKRKEPSTDASGSLGTDDSLGADRYNGVILGDTVSTLGVNCGMSHGRQCVLEAYTMQDREGKAGGGKGALFAKELSATLRAGFAQTLFQPVYSVENHPNDSRVGINEDGMVQALTSRMGTGGGNVPMALALDRASYQDKVGALCARDYKGVGSQYVDEDKLVCYSFDPTASRDAGEYILEGVANPLLNGTCPGHKSAVCYSVDQGGGESSVDVREDQAPTLTTTHDGAPAVAYSVDCRNGTEDIVNGALQSNSAHSLNGNNVVRVSCGFDPSASRDVGQYFLEEKANVLTNGSCPGHHNGVVIKHPTRYIVRRLTPLECERLQGYPDGWTDIGDYIDSQGKKRSASDASRYKALGNSIALPPWKFVLKRLCACYERDATMASLFDGIGGFPLLWEQINGKGSCLWASEIEEFPIAVTKARIGE